MTVPFLCSSVYSRHLHLVRSNNDGERCRRDDAPKASTQSEDSYPARRGSEFVVGVDGSVASYAAVSWAAHEATMRGLPIKLVHVVAPTLMSSTMAPNDTITQQRKKARQILDQARRIVDERTAEAPPNVHAELRYAGVVATLVDASRDAQMIVVGSRGLDAFGRQMLGSVSSGCPIMRTARWRSFMIRTQHSAKFATTHGSSWVSTARRPRKRQRRWPSMKPRVAVYH